MYGLALMAGELAWHRAYKEAPINGPWLPANPREVIAQAAHGVGSASKEYYAIIDRIARGERP
jgi:hypothetical protein